MVVYNSFTRSLLNVPATQRGGPKVTETVTYIRYCLPERVPRTVFITSIAGVVVGIEKAAQNDASGP